MRISDWSSDVCSSDLSRSRLLRPPPATARRRGCGYPPRRGRGAAAATPGATASCIHQPAAVEPQHAAAARGEVFVVGHQYQRGARVGVHREQQLDNRLAGVGVEIGGAHVETQVNNANQLCGFLLEKKKK